MGTITPISGDGVATDTGGDYIAWVPTGTLDSSNLVAGATAEIEFEFTATVPLTPETSTITAWFNNPNLDFNDETIDPFPYAISDSSTVQVTAAVISSFSLSRIDGKVQAEWETAVENGTAVSTSSAGLGKLKGIFA